MRWVWVALIVASTAAADLLQSYEMKRDGDLRTLWRRPPLVASVACMAVSFFAFAALLRIADLSFAVPATAASFVIETVLARWVLRERVDGRRWAGALLVAAGVGLLAV